MESSFSSLLGPMTKYKVVLLGDIYVGKTSIITRFMYDSFDMVYQATVGIDFLSKTLYMEKKTVRLQIWDTAGQERFRSLIPNYIRDSSVAVVVFDVTVKQSFLNVDRWVDDVTKERSKCATVILLGNKIDKTEDRVVSKEEASKKAEELGVVYLETSAKTGQNVEEMFNHIGSVLPGTERPSNSDNDLRDINIEMSMSKELENNKCTC